MSMRDVEQGVTQSWRHIADNVHHLHATLQNVEAVEAAFSEEGVPAEEGFTAHLHEASVVLAGISQTVPPYYEHLNAFYEQITGRTLVSLPPGIGGTVDAIEAGQHRSEVDSGSGFQAQIDTITARSLTPENIDTYADEALNDLVAVVQSMTEQYSVASATALIGAAREHAALSHFGLDENSIEAVLTHIAEQAEEIRELDSLIDQISADTAGVIVPPDERRTITTPGEKHLTAKQRIPRLKTLLFIVRNTFGIDPRSAEECTIITGKVERTMFRNESYKLVSFPALNRSVLVCDEEDNATFVFDTEKLNSKSITQASLPDMSKEDIKALLLQHPGMGRRLKYTHRFTENMVSLLRVIPEPNDEVALDDKDSKFLRHVNQGALPGHYSTYDIAREVDTTHDLASQAAAALDDKLGEVKILSYSNNTSGAIFTADQKTKIINWLEENGYIVPKALPEDATQNKMVKNWRVGPAALKQAVEDLGDALGKPTRKRVGTGYGDVYSSAQQAVIRQWLVEKEKIAKDPNVVLLSADQLAPRTGLSGVSVRKFLQKHSDRLGVQTINSRSYLPEDNVERLLDLLRELGHTIPEPPS